MASRIEDYALIGDSRRAALVGARRLDRLAVLAALRFRCLFCGAARRRPKHGRWLHRADRRSEPRHAPLPPGHADPRNALRDRRTAP